MVKEKNIGSYFHCVHEKTETEFFQNGINLTDLGLGLMAGAVGNTSNPKHIARVVKTEKEIWYPVIDELICSNPGLSDDEVADLLLQRIIGRSLKLFQPLHEASHGKLGYVAIQGNPNTNDVFEKVVGSGITYSQLGENITVKVVATAVGVRALEELTARGINTIATNGFSVSQTIAMDSAYQRGLKRSNKNPKCYVVYSAGIFDEYLTLLAERKKISISPEYISYAGLSVARVVCRVAKERGFKSKVMVGGREPQHFTGLVGGNLAITISDYTVKDILKENPLVVSKIDEETPPKILAELDRKFPEFSRACHPDGLKPEEFQRFGPCVDFQKMCEQGYAQTITEIQGRRAVLGVNCLK